MPKVAADVFAEELEKIANGHALKLVQPKAIVDAARPVSSPIHKIIDWDKNRAAERDYINQARTLVGRLTMVVAKIVPGPTHSPRGYMSVSIGGKRGFVPETRVMGDTDLTRQTIAEVRKQLHLLLAKYHHVLLFGKVIPRLQDILQEMQDEIDRLEKLAA